MSHAATNLRLGKNGRIVIPASVRDALGLREGDTLVLTVGPRRGRLVLETEEMILARLHDLVGAAPEGELVSEELLRERREEAEREARAMDL
jgi:AbrB family looped-hinge helix DNA binding protein